MGSDIEPGRQSLSDHTGYDSAVALACWRRFLLQLHPPDGGENFRAPNFRLVKREYEKALARTEL